MKYSIFFYFFILTACVSSKKLIKLAPQAKSSAVFENGIYSNCPNNLGDSCDYDFNLVDQLRLKIYKPDTLPNWNHLSVEILRKKKFLMINIFDGTIIVDKFKLKGKWKNDAFYARRFIRPMGIPPIFFIYLEKQLILKFFKDEIIVLNGRFEAIIILLLSGGIDDYSSIKYKNISSELYD